EQGIAGAVRVPVLAPYLRVPRRHWQARPAGEDDRLGAAPGLGLSRDMAVCVGHRLTEFHLRCLAGIWAASPGFARLVFRATCAEVAGVVEHGVRHLAVLRCLAGEPSGVLVRAP